MGQSQQNYSKFTKIFIFSDTSKNNKQYLQHYNTFRQLNQPLQNSVKDVGIIIDFGLKFINLHIKTLEPKIARSIGIILKLKQVLPLSALQILYLSTIHPHRFYVIVIWGSTFKTYLGKLSLLQNKAFRIIAGGH